MLRRERHHCEHPVDHLIRMEHAEQVSHRANEDHPRLPPVQRLHQRLFIQEDLNLVARGPVIPQSSAKLKEPLVLALGVAPAFLVIAVTLAAPLGNPLTVPANPVSFRIARTQRVPTCIAPFDCRTIAHLISLVAASGCWICCVRSRPSWLRGSGTRIRDSGNIESPSSSRL